MRDRSTGTEPPTGGANASANAGANAGEDASAITDAQAPDRAGGDAPHRPSLRIAVLASGNGSNLQAIIDAIAGDALTGVELVAVLSDKPGCRALERAAAAGVATGVYELGIFSAAEATAAARAVRDREMIDRLRADQVDLVVLAGYMQILSAEFVRAFAGRIINVHPSLLPAYPGLNAIEQALAAGVPTTGVTVHYVDEGVDTGPAIAQQEVSIEPGDTPASLAERIHAVEHRLLPGVIGEIAARRASING